MHAKTTLCSSGRMTPIPPIPHGAGGIDKLWVVDVQIMGTAYIHKWHGYAATEDQARERGHKAAGQTWPGFGRCVRSVQQVSA